MMLGGQGRDAWHPEGGSQSAQIRRNDDRSHIHVPGATAPDAPVVTTGVRGILHDDIFMNAQSAPERSFHIRLLPANDAHVQTGLRSLTGVGVIAVTCPGRYSGPRPEATALRLPRSWVAARRASGAAGELGLAERV